MEKTKPVSPVTMPHIPVMRFNELYSPLAFKQSDFEKRITYKAKIVPIKPIVKTIFYGDNIDTSKPDEKPEKFQLLKNSGKELDALNNRR